MTTYNAVDRDGRTVATVSAGDALEARGKLRALITEAGAPEGWYLHQDNHTWYWEHRRCRVPGTGEYVCLHEPDLPEPEPEAEL
jgi:hypothetical protein